MKFLVVDDHALIRDAMRGVLKELQSDADRSRGCKFRSGDGPDPAASRPRSHPARSASCPTATGSRRCENCANIYPAISVVMLSAFNDRDNVVRALDNGALGFIPKTDSREVLLGALRLILAGGMYIPPEILSPRTRRPLRPSQGRDGQAALAGRTGLTERQVDVLALMMEGKNNKLICRALDLAEPTVKNHVSAILKALGVTNRTEAVLAVAALGWELRPPAR